MNNLIAISLLIGLAYGGLMHGIAPSTTAGSDEYGHENCEDGIAGQKCHPPYLTGKDRENFRTVIELLLLLGKLPDNRDTITTDLGANVDMVGIVSEIDDLMNEELNSISTDDLRLLLEALVQIRTDNLQLKEERLPKWLAIEQPSVRTETSNATGIVNHDYSLDRQTEDYHNESSEDGEKPNFTDAELQLMSDEIANELAAVLKDGVTMSAEIDDAGIEAEMEEAEAERAYERFLNEQQAILPVALNKES